MNRRSRRGSNAVEFAICLPVFLYLMSAAIDMGWFFFHKAMLDHAVYVGCRGGSLLDPGKDDVWLSSVISKAETMVVNDIRAGAITCTPGPSCDVDVSITGGSPTRSLVCSATYQWRPLMGLAMPPITTTSRQVARIEWQRQ